MNRSKKMSSHRKGKGTRVTEDTIKRVKGLDKKKTGEKLANSFAKEEGYEALPPVVPAVSKGKKTSKQKGGFSKASLGLQTEKEVESEYEVGSGGDESFLSTIQSPVDKEEGGEEDYEEEAAGMLAGASGLYQTKAREIVTEARSVNRDAIRIPPGGDLFSSIQYLLLQLNSREGTNYHVEVGRSQELLVYPESTPQPCPALNPSASTQVQTMETKALSSHVDEADFTMTETNWEVDEKVKEYARALDTGIIIPCKTRRAPAKITSSRSGFDRFSLITAIELNPGADFPSVFLYLLKRSPDFKVFRAGYRLDQIQYPC